MTRLIAMWIYNMSYSYQLFVKLPFWSGFPLKWHNPKYSCSSIHESFTQDRPNSRSNLSREFLQFWRRRVLTCRSDDGWLTFLDGYCSTWWVLWLCSWTARVPFLASWAGSQHVGVQRLTYQVILASEIFSAIQIYDRIIPWPTKKQKTKTKLL